MFDQIKANLVEIQPEKRQNVQKTGFLQKAPGFNGLIFSKITVFFFCFFHLKLTNLEVRHLIQVTKSYLYKFGDQHILRGTRNKSAYY